MWQLVARHLSNEATEEETCALKKMMEEDPCLQFSMGVLTQFWESNEDKPAAQKTKDNDRLDCS